jgi:hypothetical protein
MPAFKHDWLGQRIEVEFVAQRDGGGVNEADSVSLERSGMLLPLA